MHTRTLYNARTFIYYTSYASPSIIFFTRSKKLSKHSIIPPPPISRKNLKTSPLFLILTRSNKPFVWSFNYWTSIISFYKNDNHYPTIFVYWHHKLCLNKHLMVIINCLCTLFKSSYLHHQLFNSPYTYYCHLIYSVISYWSPLSFTSEVRY